MSQVRLILHEDVPGLGEAGELVSVKPGYARNLLMPRGMASLATESKIQELEHRKRVIAERAAKDLKGLEAIKQRIEASALALSARAGEEGKLFGSVTRAQIAARLAEQGLEIDRRKIDLRDSIRTLGEHTIPIKLRQSVVANLKVVITAAD